MTSDQFSEKPLPSVTKMCAACGAIAPSRAAVACWMCGESFMTSESAKSAPVKPTHEWPTASTRDGGFWDLAWMFMGLVGVVLLVVVGYEAPGLLMCLVPSAAGIIFQIVVHRNRDQAVPWTGRQGCLSFLATIGVVAFFGFASLIVAIQIICSRPMGR